MTTPPTPDAVPYGYCPKCGARGKLRERRPNGNDMCENKCVYPSRDAVKEAPPTPDAGSITIEGHTYHRRENGEWYDVASEWMQGDRHTFDHIATLTQSERQAHDEVQRLHAAYDHVIAENVQLTAQLAAAKPLSEWRILNVRGEAVADATHPDEHTLPWWDRNRPNDAPHRLVQLAIIDAAREAMWRAIVDQRDEP